MLLTPRFFRGFVLVALLALTACASYLDTRAESALRDALVRVVGPAESYDVQVAGASLDGGRFERVRFVGRRIARANAPVLDRLELDLEGVVVDRREKALTAVAASRAELQVTGADVAAYLRRWLVDPTVTLAAPDRIGIAGAPRLGGIAITGNDGAEFQGRLVGTGSQLHLRIERIRLGRSDAPALARALLERAINPLFDVAAYPLPAQIDAVEVVDDRIRIAASGSVLPKTAP